MLNQTVGSMIVVFVMIKDDPLFIFLYCYFLAQFVNNKPKKLKIGIIMDT